MAFEDFDETHVASLFAVFILSLAFSSAVNINQFIETIKKPKGIIIGIFCQYILLPFIAFIISLSFSNYLLPEQQIGLIIIGTMPGGLLSNFFCFLFAADLTLSIAMTTMSSLTSFIFITINGLIYIPIISKTTNLKIDYISLLLSVVTLIIAVLIGLFVSYRNYKIISKIIGIIASITVIFTIFITLITNVLSGYPLWKLSWSALIAPILLSSFAWFISFLIANMFKLNNNSCVAVSIECCCQNAPFAVVIMMLTFDTNTSIDIALGIPIVYAMWNLIQNIMIGLIFKRCGYLKTDENDKTVTFSKLFNKWTRKENENENENDTASDIDTENDDINKIEMEIEEEQNKMSDTQNSIDIEI